MKFGKSLSNQIEETLPEWRENFLSYKDLKKRLKLIEPKAGENRAKRPRLASPRDSVDGCGGEEEVALEMTKEESDFIELLEGQIEKFNGFFIEKEEDYIIRVKFSAGIQQNTMAEKDGDGENGKKQISLSPYYLHPSDHPGMNICPVILKGDNYQEWEISMRNAFLAKRKLGFLDGHVTEPTADASNIEDWWSVNSMLVAWIIQSIEPSLRSTITYYDTVRELWDDLHQRFSIGNGPRILQLRSELARCDQNGQSVAAYYGHMKKIWDELSTYITKRACTCGKCVCKWAADLSKEREDERVHQFLMGLDDDLYGTLRSNIIAQDPLPPLNKVYALVVQEERHKTMTKGREARTEAAAFAVHGGTRGRSEKGVCTNCGRQGHEVTSCFKIIGYPEWWNTGRGNGKSTGKGTGGAADSIIGRGRGKTPVGAANAAHFAAPSSGSPILTSQDRSAVGPALTDGQWNTILNMFKSLNNNSASNEKLTGPHFEDGDWSG